jgi:hypothetical protein|tara:strand:- start:183 stop:566 length:384 start_codon:yes stop_codon:yes gene_type:complete
MRPLRIFLTSVLFFHFLLCNNIYPKTKKIKIKLVYPPETNEEFNTPQEEIIMYTSEHWYRYSDVLVEDYDLNPDEQIIIVKAHGWKLRLYSWINWYETPITKSLFTYLVLHSSIYKEHISVTKSSPF